MLIFGHLEGLCFGGSFLCFAHNVKDRLVRLTNRRKGVFLAWVERLPKRDAAGDKRFEKMKSTETCQGVYFVSRSTCLIFSEHLSRTYRHHICSPRRTCFGRQTISSHARKHMFRLKMEYTCLTCNVLLRSTCWSENNITEWDK